MYYRNKTYDLGYCDESVYTRVVCVYIYKDKFKNNILPYIAIIVQILIGCVTL